MAGAQEQKVQSGQVVAYVGTADEVKISAADWKSIGVEDQKQVVWDSSNRHQVPVSELAQGALNYLDQSDDRFVVKNVDVTS